MEQVDIELRLREIDNLKLLAQSEEDWALYDELDEEEEILLSLLGDN